MLKIGEKAPEFTTFDQDGLEVSLSDFHQKWILLYFYPKDDTPGCTKEACGFRDSYQELKKRAVVLGVSADSQESHKNFAKKFELPFRLLSDPDMELIKKYQAYGEKSMFGKKYKGILRISYLINPAGTIVKVYKKVNAAKHAEEVLEDIKKFKRN